jgi:hypothetical protein
VGLSGGPAQSAGDAVSTKKRRGRKRVGRQNYASRQRRLHAAKERVKELEREKEVLIATEREWEEDVLRAKETEIEEVLRAKETEREEANRKQSDLQWRHNQLKSLYYKEQQEKYNLLWVARGVVERK